MAETFSSQLLYVAGFQICHAPKIDIVNCMSWNSP